MLWPTVGLVQLHYPHTVALFRPRTNLKLFPDLRDKKVLDIGCGSGLSLKWCGDNGVSELWGLDMSTKQIENARQFLNENGYAPTLFNSPMELDCGLPKE